MKKFNLFLTITLGATAFLAGYLFISGDLGSPASKTGTILDKFEETSGKTTDSKLAEEDLMPVILVDRPVTSVSNSRDTKGVRFFEKNTGKAFELDLETKTEQIVSDNSLPDFSYALWSPLKKEVVGSFFSQEGQVFRYMDYGTGNTLYLDKNIRSLAFSPDGSLIAYYYFDEMASPSQGKIMVSEPNGQYQKKIIDTRIENIEVSWPAKDRIVLKTPLNEIFLITEDGKLNKFLDSKPLLEEKWSRTGEKLLYSALDKYDPSAEPLLTVKDIGTRTEKILNAAGNARKCAWSIDDVNIYCALAKSPTEDELYLINTAEDTKKLLLDLHGQVKDIFLSLTEDYLLYTNASDNKLYGINLP